MILDTIAARTKERIAARKEEVPLEQIREQALALGGNTEFPFEQALCGETIRFICEIKKASPSKGVIAAEFPYLEIAGDYERAGAAAISCLTEPFYFQGRDAFLKEITEKVSIPVLRKDFTVDEYMIYEAKTLGASAILLICSILGKEQLKEYLELADSLGLSALVETHDEKEVEMALEGAARIIGVNNRNLQTFEVNIDNSVRLRNLVPPEKIFVSESGVKTPDDIRALRENGTNAVLVGETLMRSENKKAMLARLRGEAYGRDEAK